MPRPSASPLDHPDEARAHFEQFGWVLTQPLDGDEVDQVRRWVDEVSAWPDDGPALQYREMTASGPRLCRSEDFVPHHDGLRELLTSGALLDTASNLLGETAVLYKEKINHKVAGGAGYAPHQDAPAYRFVETHVSCMVAIDDADLANGCLEVVSAQHHALLPTDERGCVRDDIVSTLTWTPAPVRAGQALWFHSRTPHRSGPNTSPVDRRALFPTYNALREGDLRDAYYRQKAVEFAERGTAAVSLIGDFEGVVL